VVTLASRYGSVSREVSRYPSPYAQVTWQAVGASTVVPTASSRRPVWSYASCDTCASAWILAPRVRSPASFSSPWPPAPEATVPSVRRVRTARSWAASSPLRRSRALLRFVRAAQRWSAYPLRGS